MRCGRCVYCPPPPHARQDLVILTRTIRFSMRIICSRRLFFSWTALLYPVRGVGNNGNYLACRYHAAYRPPYHSGLTDSGRPDAVHDHIDMSTRSVANSALGWALRKTRLLSVGKGWNAISMQLRKVDAGVYSNTLRGGRNNCTLREENRLRKLYYVVIWIGTRIHFPQLREDCASAWSCRSSADVAIGRGEGFLSASPIFGLEIPSFFFACFIPQPYFIQIFLIVVSEFGNTPEKRTHGKVEIFLWGILVVTNFSKAPRWHESALS